MDNKRIIEEISSLKAKLQMMEQVLNHVMDKTDRIIDRMDRDMSMTYTGNPIQAEGNAEVIKAKE